MWPPSWERFIVINSLQHYQVRGGKDQPWTGEMWLAADLGKPRNTVVKSKTWKWKPWSEEMFCTLVVVFHLRRRWHPTPVLLPGKSHGWRSLVGCSPWGHKESDTTEQLHFHFSLSCIGEGNGNPLQCSCLENPRDGVAWWAAIYGVTQSQTWLMQLSSSSSSIYFISGDCFNFL